MDELQAYQEWYETEMDNNKADNDGVDGTISEAQYKACENGDIANLEAFQEL